MRFEERKEKSPDLRAEQNKITFYKKKLSTFLQLTSQINLVYEFICL